MPALSEGKDIVKIGCEERRLAGFKFHFPRVSVHTDPRFPPPLGSRKLHNIDILANDQLAIHHRVRVYELGLSLVWLENEIELARRPFADEHDV